MATYLDKSAHRHEYADPFGAYDGDNDYDDYDDGGYVYFDLEGLSFYLWVVCRPLFESYLLISTQVYVPRDIGRRSQAFPYGTL